MYIKNKYYFGSVEAIASARESRAAYMRRWRAANKDKVRQINQKYWERRAEKEKAAATENH